MVSEDEKVHMLIKPKKKSKKRKKRASTNGLGVTKGDVKAIESDLSFKEEKLPFVGGINERYNRKMETKTSGNSEDGDIKRKKERHGGKQPGKSSNESFENASKSVVKKKKKLKNEPETMHDTLLDTKAISHESVSSTQETKMADRFGKGSGRNIIDEAKRNKREKENRKRKDGQVDIVSGVDQGDVSTVEEIEDSKIDDANIRKRKKTKLGHNSNDATHEKSEKRVRFAGHVQVLTPLSYTRDENHEFKEEKLLFGERFTREEDEIVKDAVCRYIDVHNLGEGGLHKVLNCQSFPELRCCWKKIGSAIPYRPYRAVYFRAQRLFRMGKKRKWTEEEFDRVRKYHRDHGPKWRLLADELGKHEQHVSKAWNRIKLANQKRGKWSQEEIQSLFDLVNTDLQMKLYEEKKSKHGMLRDNICWSAISDNLSTRASHLCCLKWYNQLTSPMVVTGEWADADDYRLIDTLFELDASCLEDVDWDNLLENRPGELCRKRWNQMVLQLSKHENKSFTEQVEVLAKRYRPDLVGAREAWDSKPVVP